MENLFISLYGMGIWEVLNMKKANQKQEVSIKFNDVITPTDYYKVSL